MNEAIAENSDQQASLGEYLREVGKTYHPDVNQGDSAKEDMFKYFNDYKIQAKQEVERTGNYTPFEEYVKNVKAEKIAAEVAHERWAREQHGAAAAAYYDAGKKQEEAVAAGTATREDWRAASERNHYQKQDSHRSQTASASKESAERARKESRRMPGFRNEYVYDAYNRQNYVGRMMRDRFAGNQRISNAFNVAFGDDDEEAVAQNGLDIFVLWEIANRIPGFYTSSPINTGYQAALDFCLGFNMINEEGELVDSLFGEKVKNANLILPINLGHGVVILTSVPIADLVVDLHKVRQEKTAHAKAA